MVYNLGMRAEQVQKTVLLLRISLAFVFIYAGIRSLINPTDWVGFVPDWVSNFGFTRENALFAHALLDIALGLLFLGNVKVKFFSLIAAILLFVIALAPGFGVLDITFRDIGLGIAALALFFAV